MLQPTRTKYRKAHKGRIHGHAGRGEILNYGSYGLKAIEPGWITARQIEASRIVISRVVRKIGKIISSVENADFGLTQTDSVSINKDRLITNSICYHAALLADRIKASAVCTLTNSGYTGWQISSWRPNCLVLVFTSNKRILSQLNLLWGVKGVYYNKLQSTDKTVEDVNALALKNRYVKKGDTVVNLAAMPIKEMGQVNTLRITQV